MPAAFVNPFAKVGETVENNILCIEARAR